jgi:hypothetical protein
MNTILLYTIPFFTGDLDTASIVMFILAAIAFIFAWAVNRVSILRIRKRVQESKDIRDIMQRTLDENNNFVVRLDLRDRWAYNVHGDMLPEKGLSYEKSMNYVHPDDREPYRNFLKSLINGTAKTAECTFRWDFSRELGLGNWHYLLDLGVAEYAFLCCGSGFRFFVHLVDGLDHEEYNKSDEDEVYDLAYKGSDSDR